MSFFGGQSGWGHILKASSPGSPSGLHCAPPSQCEKKSGGQMRRLGKPPPTQCRVCGDCAKGLAAGEPLSVTDTKDSYLAHFPSTSGSETSVTQDPWPHSMSPTGSEQVRRHWVCSPPEGLNPVLSPFPGPSRVGRCW